MIGSTVQSTTQRSEAMLDNFRRRSLNDIWLFSLLPPVALVKLLMSLLLETELLDCGCSLNNGDTNVRRPLFRAWFGFSSVAINFDLVLEYMVLLKPSAYIMIFIQWMMLESRRTVETNAEVLFERITFSLSWINFSVDEFFPPFALCRGKWDNENDEKQVLSKLAIIERSDPTPPDRIERRNNNHERWEHRIISKKIFSRE